MTYGDMMRAVKWYAYQANSKKLHQVVTVYRVTLRAYAEDGDAYTRARLAYSESELANAYRECSR